MSFQPIVPFTGYSGWVFLNRTLDNQKTTYTASAPVTRTTDYFRENIAKATTADDLVNDRRLLEVALGAFGLQDDLPNKAFIRKVLAEGTTNEDSFANRLADKRYAALAAAFGYDKTTPQVGKKGFADQIVAKYLERSFEVAVGEQNGDMRMALSVKATVSDLMSATKSDNSRWFGMMGNEALRTVFEKALGLPNSFAQLDIDQQLTEFKDRASSVFGVESFADFADPAIQEKVIRLFLVRSEAEQVANTSSASIVLSLLRG